jgi:hypothetical protein
MTSFFIAIAVKTSNLTSLLRIEVLSLSVYSHSGLSFLSPNSGCASRDMDFLSHFYETSAYVMNYRYVVNMS